jgi:hypothetical protein
MESSNTLCQCWSRNRQRKLSHCKMRNHLSNWVTADGWNRQRILIHGWGTKSKDKTGSSLTHGIASETASTLTRNRHLKQSHCRPWNRHWNMSGSWRMKSTPSKNSRPTRETDSKNRFLFDARNCQTHYASADPEIVSENRVTVEREIMFETESRLTNGIDNAS